MRDASACIRRHHAFPAPRTPGRLRLVDCAWFQRLKLKFDGPHSDSALNFSLRPYSMAFQITSEPRVLVPRGGGVGGEEISKGDDDVGALGVEGEGEGAGAGGFAGRDLHSSTFRLDVSAFCGIRWVVSVFH
jgi:hypothetical protein